MINTADDIIAALRNLIADYEQRLPASSPPATAAPAQPAPPAPAGAATPSIEDMGRRCAMNGQATFLEFFHSRTRDEQLRLRAIKPEIEGLYPK